ncbi:MAG: chloride channel protein [Pseudomonadota bacterium]
MALFDTKGKSKSGTGTPALASRIGRVFLPLWRWVEPNLAYFMATRQPTLWVMGLIAGLLAGAATILFREGIAVIQYLWLAEMSEFVATAAHLQPWWIILIAPAIGGLIVGLMLEYMLPSKRAFGVADVIEARIGSARRIPFRQALGSALVSIVSLGFGASTGREGPVVHLGAAISSYFGEKLALDGKGYRTLLGCGVAAAVSASFNAPIAGVLFAHEVILGHYAASAFVPIVIASVAGTVLSRLYFGETAAFIIPDYQITSYWEFPAFAILGVVCAFVAIGFQVAVIGSDWFARRFTIKLWLRPVIGGFMIGAIACFYPEILGVGYEATNQALYGLMSLETLLILLVVKTAATAISLASRFGGGVFSPALYLGAMAGGAFGLIAASVFPEFASSGGVYSIIGMGAVSAAVIGAPISTVLIVFELTGGYTLTIALLVTVAIAHGLTQAFHGRSFFHWQLEMRGLFVQDGPHRYVVKNTLVREVMRAVPDDTSEEIFDPASGAMYLREGDSLESALRAFDASGDQFIAVVSGTQKLRINGYIWQVDALRRFNSALIRVSEEEHR